MICAAGVLGCHVPKNCKKNRTAEKTKVPKPAKYPQIIRNMDSKSLKLRDVCTVLESSIQNKHCDKFVLIIHIFCVNLHPQRYLFNGP